MTKTRLELLNTLIFRIIQARKNYRRPFKIGIDGLDGAGKSTFSKELLTLMQEEKYPVIHSSIDKFHNNRQIRYSLGERSPEGYYRHSFNYEILLEYLLLPMMESENINIRSSAFDYKRDTASAAEPITVPSDTILLFDGIFLSCSRLQKYWDMLIFIHTDIEIILPRVKARDAGNAAEIETLYLEKYIPGQFLYLKECNPHLQADVVINNNNFDHPYFMVNRREKELYLQYTLDYFERKKDENEI